MTDRYLKAFDTAATDFERLGEHLWKPIGRATVERTAPAPGERVLDACCGNGASAIPAAERVGDHGRVDAVDRSAAMIEDLRSRTGGLPALSAHAADVTSWPGDGYDVVQAVLGVFFFPDMTAGTEYLVSRARPGGRCGFTIWRRGAVVTAGDHLRQAVSRVTGRPAEPRPAGPVEAVNLAGDFHAWLAGRGLTDVTVTTHELSLPLTPEIAWLVVTGSGFVTALSGLDQTQVAGVREAYLDSLRRAGETELDATTLIGVGYSQGSNALVM
ncbi:class I SAM-dependent methyltransferase [Actinoplanes subglobosus]|uniref:Class I SAM-dependent methyltransferase n=1 Tax=Actinoplanes subglobosus TaxID=1547892 RepID=A0ABV8J0U9_9ACTN